MKVYIPRILEICKLLKKNKIKNYMFDYGYREDYQLWIFPNNKIAFQSGFKFKYFKVQKDGSVNFPRNQNNRFCLCFIYNNRLFFHQFYVELKYFKVKKPPLTIKIKQLLDVLSEVVKKNAQRIRSNNERYINFKFIKITLFDKSLVISSSYKHKLFGDGGVYIRYNPNDKKDNSLFVSNMFVEKPIFFEKYLKKLILIVVSN